VANCRAMYYARHIDYVMDGSTPIPIVARDRSCRSADVCTLPTCPLVAEVTGSGGCACMTDTFDLDYGAGTWEGLPGSACAGGPIQYHLEMTELTCDMRGFALLRLTVTCGATNTGSASLVVSCEELDELDVTLPVTMTDPDEPPSCCEGQILVRLLR